MDIKAALLHDECMRSFFLIFLLSLPGYAFRVVSQTVGQAGETVVTSREVQIATIVEGVLFPSGDKKASAETPQNQSEFSNAVASVLLEIIVSFEAENFNVASVPTEELSATVAKLEKALAGKPAWTALEVSTNELRRVTERKLTAKSFLRFKTSSMVSIITDQEAQSYYEKNRLKFGSEPFSEFREKIKTFLGQQQLEDRLRAWFEVIKRKYRVRNFVSG